MTSNAVTVMELVREDVIGGASMKLATEDTINAARTKPVPGGVTMDRGECGNDRPGFGVHSVTHKLNAYNIIRV